MPKTGQSRRQPDPEDLDRTLLKRFGPRSLGRTEPGASPAVVPSVGDVCFVGGGKEIDRALYFVAVCRGPRRRPKRQKRKRSSAEKSPHDPARKR